MKISMNSEHKCKFVLYIYVKLLSYLFAKIMFLCDGCYKQDVCILNQFRNPMI